MSASRCRSAVMLESPYCGTLLAPSAFVFSEVSVCLDGLPFVHVLRISDAAVRTATSDGVVVCSADLSLSIPLFLLFGLATAFFHPFIPSPFVLLMVYRPGILSCSPRFT